MLKRWCALIALGSLICMFCQPGHTQAAAQKEPDIPTLYGFPLWLRNLTDLTPMIERKDVTVLQKTEVLLTWLSEERNAPSPPSTGLGGGRIDSSYIQQQLIQSLIAHADTQALLWLASSGRVKEKDTLDALHIALAGKGDVSEIPALIHILKAHPNGDYRSLAVSMLQLLDAKEAIPALQDALKDEYNTRAGNSHGIYTRYPVRERATQALRFFQFYPDRVSLLSTTRKKRFADETKDYKQYAVDNKVMLERLLTAANLSDKSRPADPSRKTAPGSPASDQPDP